VVWGFCYLRIFKKRDPISGPSLPGQICQSVKCQKRKICNKIAIIFFCVVIKDKASNAR
jgi:hypothetical protein